MFYEEDEDLREFKEILLAVTQIFGLLINDRVFKIEYGFSMTEYVSLRHSCANEIRRVADSIKKVVKDTGITRTTGGSLAVVSGAATLGGLILAPFTAGASLVLTVGGIAGGVTSATLTLAAGIIKEKNVKEKAEKVKKLLDSLNEKDEVVCKIIEELKKKVKKLQTLYGKTSVISFLGDSAKIAMWMKNIGYNIVYKGYTLFSSVKSIAIAHKVTNFIQADLNAMRGIATGISSPGFKLFGKTLLLAGSTSAKVVSGVFSVVGIGFGIWDIVSGAIDINGSEHAKAYRKAADELDQQTNEYEDLLNRIKLT